METPQCLPCSPHQHPPSPRALSSACRGTDLGMEGLSLVFCLQSDRFGDRSGDRGTVALTTLAEGQEAVALFVPMHLGTDLGQRVFCSGCTHGEGRSRTEVASVAMPLGGTDWGQIWGQISGHIDPAPGRGQGPRGGGPGGGWAARATVASQCHLVASAMWRGSPRWHHGGPS